MARAWRASRFVAVSLVLVGLWQGHAMAQTERPQPAPETGANLVPIARHFVIQQITFGANYHSVLDGCVDPGHRRIMRFEFLIHNIGTEDVVIGNPLDYPGLFAYAKGHSHYHVEGFNEFKLLDQYGYSVTPATKQGFCLVDTEKMDPEAGPAKFGTCAYQGISAGWADLYTHQLSCQFMVIGNIPDGLYTLRSTTNVKQVVSESNYEDNTNYTDLRILRGRVTALRVHTNETWIPGNGRRPPRK